jgi:DHA1 family multidrug resistance protein-like MFS transporter
MDKRILIIMILLFLTFLGFGIIIPVFPLIIVDSGADRFHLYIMLSTYSIASFLLSPLWGSLSDRIGRRPVILIGTIGFSISFFIFAISTDYLIWMYFSRLLGGVFSGAVTACAIAYVADITSEQMRTRTMGLVGMAIGLGFIFGPAIGGLFSMQGLSIPFFIASIVSLSAFVLAFQWLAESHPPSSTTSPEQVWVSRWTAFEGSIKYLFIIVFIITFTLAGLESTLQYFLVDGFQIVPQEIGFMFLISGIVGAVVQGGVIRKYAIAGREPWFIRSGLLLQAVGFILIIYSWNFWSAAFFLAIYAAGNALVRPCVTSLITQTTKHGQGLTGGLSSSMDSLGRIVGPLIAGGLFEGLSVLPYVTGAFISLGAIVLIQRFTTLHHLSGREEAK